MSKIPLQCLGCKLWLENKKEKDMDSFERISWNILSILRSFHRRIKKLEEKVK